MVCGYCHIIVYIIIKTNCKTFFFMNSCWCFESMQIDGTAFDILNNNKHITHVIDNIPKIGVIINVFELWSVSLKVITLYIHTFIMMYIAWAVKNLICSLLMKFSFYHDLWNVIVMKQKTLYVWFQSFTLLLPMYSVAQCFDMTLTFVHNIK